MKPSGEGKQENLTKGNIKSFRVKENKRKNAKRALELSDKDDLISFKSLFDKIAESMI